VNAYRKPSEPSRSRKTIVLPRPRALRVILGACLWFLAFWFLVFPVMWTVEALVSGEALWRLFVVPPAWLLIVWAIVRLMRFDQVMIGSEELRRAGFLRDRRVRWSEVRGFEERMKHRPRGRPVRLYAVQTDGKELLVTPDVVVDPERTLRWCLDRAKAGELTDIDDRVRADGVRFSALPRRLTHLGVALVLSVGVGTLIWGQEQERSARRIFEEAADAPYAERMAALNELFEDEGLDPHLRCRVGASIEGAAARHGELQRGVAVCATMETLGCTTYTGDAVDCAKEPSVVLGQVRAALDAGDAQRALGLLGSLRFRGAFRDSLEVEVLRASGSPAMARVVAERCVDQYADAEDPTIRAFAERCRGAL